TKTLMPLKPKLRFRDDDVLATEKIIKEFFSNNGYPNATVLKDIRLNENLNIADINFNINSGAKAYFGEVSLQGDSLIPRSYINKRIELYPGEEYSQTKLDNTQQELFNTGLFRYITIKTKLDSIENAKVPILIQVKEMPRWSFKIGLGYGTEDKVRISFLLTRLNFIGGGRTLIFKGQHSYFVPLSLDAKFIQPDVVLNNLDLILNPFLSWEHEDSYEVKRVGTAVTFQKDITKKTSAYISYNLGIDMVDLSSSGSLISEETPINSKNNKSGLTLGFNHNTSNDPFSPTKGWKFNTLGTYMGIGFNSQYHYYKLITEGDYFLPVGKRFVLACKLKGGIIDPVQGDLSTPIEDRFLMGGALSLRGWGRNQISPVNDDGVKIGGNTMLESSAELRFPIYRIFSGTTFIDFGNAWENSWNFNLNEMLYNFGLGLRIKSPIGPIRLDVATPIFDQKFNAQFFITIGHAF
ncbi:outer membrane protein assembly factor, partial [Bacteroidota bacterium]